VQRIYGEDAPSDWLKRLQIGRQIAENESLNSHDKYAADHNRKALPHKYQVGQMVFLDVRQFQGKNRKLAANWEGPYPIVQVCDNGTVFLKLKHKVVQYNVRRIKPYTAPFSSTQVEVPVQLPPEPPQLRQSDQSQPIDLLPPPPPRNFEPQVPDEPQAPQTPQVVPPRPRGRPRRVQSPPPVQTTICTASTTATKQTTLSSVTSYNF
jgi:hypothetical protein